MDDEIIQQVKSQINPPFDDLYDDTEEVVLLVLVDAAKEYLHHNRKIFSRLRLTEYKKKLRLSISALKMRSRNTELSDGEVDAFLKDLPESEFTGNIWTNDFLWKNVKPKYRQLGFSDILLTDLDKEDLILDQNNDGKFLYDKNPEITRDFFKHHFLDYFKILERKWEEEKNKTPSPVVSRRNSETNTEFTSTQVGTSNLTKTPVFKFPDYIKNEHLLQSLLKDLEVWCECEKIKTSKNSIERQELSNLVKDKYLNKSYFFGNLYSPASKEEQNKILKSSGGYKLFLRSTPRLDIITDVQRIVKNRIESKLLPEYYASEEFIERQKILKKLEKEKRKQQKLAEARALKFKAFKGFWPTN